MNVRMKIIKMLVRRFSDGRYRKTNYRCIVEGLSSRTSWQVAKTYDQSTYIKRRVLYYTTDIIYTYIRKYTSGNSSQVWVTVDRQL